MLQALLLSLFVSGVALAAPKNPGPPEPDDNPTPVQFGAWDFVFPSGFRVVLQPDDTQPLVATTMVVDAGQSAEPAGKDGLAHLAEHLFFRSDDGTGTPWDILARAGCDANAWTALDTVEYATICPSSAVPTLLKLESRRLTDPLAGVTEEILEVEKEVVRNELRMFTESTVGVLWPYVLPQLFGEGHPLLRSRGETHETLDALTLDDLRTFVTETYRPDRATFSMVGDIGSFPASLLFVNMEPGIFHSELSREHLAKWPAEGVTQPDPKNPEHWRIWPLDPNTEGKQLDGSGTPVPRVTGPAPEPPPVVNAGPTTHEAPIGRPAAVLAWSLPGGARSNDLALAQAAAFLEIGLAARFLDYDGPELDCATFSEAASSVLACVVTFDSVGDREPTVQRMLKNLEEGRSSTLRDSADFSERRGKRQQLESLIAELGVVASLEEGRAAKVAHHAHRTGSAQLFRDLVQQVNDGSTATAFDLLKKWVKKDRAAVVYLDPADSVLPATSPHAASLPEVRRGIDSAALTPDAIARATVPPDVTRIAEKTLDNGLRVIAMRHGSIPDVQIGLSFGNGSDPLLAGAAAESRRWTVDLSAPTFDARYFGRWELGHETTGVVVAAGNLAGGLWLLRQQMNNISFDINDQREYARQAHDLLSREMQTRSHWVRRAEYGLLAPSYAGVDPVHPGRFQDVRALKGSVLRTFGKRKYQPANALLVMVGDLDPAAAVESAEYYLGGWSASRKAEIGPLRTEPKPPAKTSRVVVFEDDSASQSTLRFSCVLPVADAEQADALEVGRRIASTRLDDALRQRTGLTYGVTASTRVSDEGFASLTIDTRVQSDAVADAALAIRDTVSKLQSGLSVEEVRGSALTYGVSLPLRLQTLDQMEEELSSTAMRGGTLATWRSLPERLGGMTPEAVQARYTGCFDHSVLTVFGPATQTESLQAVGIPFETVDWWSTAHRELTELAPEQAEAWVR